jgi:hypothetical protein
MRKTITIQILLLISLVHYKSNAIVRELADFTSLSEHKIAKNLYIENKGQIGDQHGKPNREVQYLIHRSGLNIQLKANSFSYDAYTVERFKRVERLEEPFPSKLDKHNDDSLVYHFSRVDIELVDANPNPEITQEGASSDYLNYYTHITSQTQGEAGATGVRGYSNIVYHDIYPNIDLEWFLDKEGKPEYQFIINPEGDPSKIRLKYHGAQKTELISDAIHIHIKPGIIKEHIPLSYLKESQEKLQIAFTKLDNDEYGFSIPTFASNETLIIDPMPNRLWGTYYGGSGSDYGRDVSIDQTGNIYLVGETTSSTDMATAGAWDVTYDGNSDAFVSLFTSNGSRVWGTYYGGNGQDYANGIVIEASGTIYISGFTKSSYGIATNGSWDITLSGTADAFLSKLSSTGALVWGTYYGGNGSDDGGRLAIDTFGDLYMAGSTTSSIDIASIGAWDITYGGNLDVMLVKFSSSGNRIWSTYYGGVSNDGIADIDTDPSGNVYIAGGTESNTDIASAGAWDINYNGATDVFIAKFSSSGSRVWGTYYGGSGLDDGGYLDVDGFGNVYLSGGTTSSSDIASTGAWDITYGGNGDAYLAKFSTNGVRIWGTYYGGNDYDYGLNPKLDALGNVFVTGTTKSTTDIASTGSWDATYGGNSDAFLMKFSSNGGRLWGTYYGGFGEDIGIATFVDQAGSTVVSGYTASTTDIATTNGWDQIFGGGIYDGFLVKFNENQINLQPLSKNTYCQNESISISYTVVGSFLSPNTFTAQLSNSFGSFASPTIIGSVSSTTSGTINCRIPSNIVYGSGYRIRIVSSNPNVQSDDNGSNIIIHELPNTVISGSAITCLGQSPYTYSVPSMVGHTYFWQTPNRGTIMGSNSGNMVTIRWLMTGQDTVKVKQTNITTGCMKDTTFIVNIQQSPNPIIQGNSSVCSRSYNIGYSVVNIPGHSYQWFSPNKGSINGSTTSNAISVNWIDAGTDSIRVRETNIQTGCFKDTSFKVTIQPLPNPVISGKQNVCVNSMNNDYSILNIPGHTYQWFTPKKGIINGPQTYHSVSITWTESGFDTLRLRHTNPFSGCSKDTSIIVRINPQPKSLITGLNNVCIDNKISIYQVPLLSGLKYEWSPLKRGTIRNSVNSDILEVFWTTLGVDTVKVRTTDSSTGCFSDTVLLVTINSLPNPVINGDEKLCLTDTIYEYSVKDELNTDYLWNSPKLGSINSQSNLNKIIVKWEKAGIDTLFVRETNKSTGCFKDTLKIIRILPKPQTTISGSSEVVEQSKGQIFSAILDSGSTYKWSIVSGDANIVTEIDNIAKLDFGKRGTVELKVFQTNKDGCVNEAQFVITVKAPTSVQDVAHLMFTVYPNPTEASDELLVQIADLNTRVLQIELVDVMGVSMVKTSIEQNNGIIPINIHGITSGMYIVRVHTAKGIFSEKVIVQ